MYIQTNLEEFIEDIVSEYEKITMIETNLDNEIYIKKIIAISKSVVSWLGKMRIEAC